MNEKGILYGREVEVAPFIVVRVAWSGLDSQDPAITMNAFSWMGWMARAPMDWTGVLEGLRMCAPEGARCETGTLAGEMTPDEVAALAGRAILFPMKPSGRNAPWIDSEESEYRNRDSSRLLCLGIEWVVETSIPREYSQSWCDQMDRKYLDGARAQIESALALSGFGCVEFLGRFDDLSGSSYWGNVAVERWAGWTARQERENLELAIPRGETSGMKSTL